MASPERARTWIQTILPVVREGGPVLTLVVAIGAIIVVWALTREITRLHQVNAKLADRLVQVQNKHVAHLRS